MRTLAIDLETYSDINLQKCGVYRYAESTNFEILLMAYAWDDEPVQLVDLARGEEIPSEVLSALVAANVTKTAYNANFEIVCLARHFEQFVGRTMGQMLNASQWRCTAAHAATLGFPRSLYGVTSAMKLPVEKHGSGMALIKYFSIPCKPTKKNGGRTRNYWYHDREKWDTYRAYCVQDVTVEREVRRRLERYPMLPIEQETWELDQRINGRGVGVDLDLVKAALAISSEHNEALMLEARQIAGISPKSVPQLQKWLLEELPDDYAVDDVRKDTIAFLRGAQADPVIDRILEIRQEISKTSVRKYEAMRQMAGDGDRARGTMMYYGANRTGRWSGKGIQVQNLRKNSLPDLDTARELVRSGDLPMTRLLYGNVPEVLSQLIRTALVPAPGHVFAVADFSAIEARVLAWLANERWRMDVFAGDGRIYERSAEQMFRLPAGSVRKGDPMRQRGKVAELACIAEGELVLTDLGLVPIENVTTAHKVWDGAAWVPHDGVVYRGIKEVMEYAGLRATKDHLVWIEGKSEPVQFGYAAACGACLLQTGSGRRSIRLGSGDFPGETMEPKNELLPCPDAVYRLRKHTMAKPEQPDEWQITRVSDLLAAKTDTQMAGQAINCGEATLRKSERSELCKLRCAGDPVAVCICSGSREIHSQNTPPSFAEHGTGQNRHQRPLRAGEPAHGDTGGKPGQSPGRHSDSMGSKVLALFEKCGDSKAVKRIDARGDHQGRRNSGIRKTEELAWHPSAVKVYDIRNAGPHHRFTVSGKLVHNCGYGGSVGALMKMDALDQGLEECELKPLVDAWRAANARIVDAWWATGDAALAAVKGHSTRQLMKGMLVHAWGGFMSIKLPSGRVLRYVGPQLLPNPHQSGRESVTYMGVEDGKWKRVYTYGPKIIENITQAIARDCLRDAMLGIEAAGGRIVMHVHDEAVVEVPEREADAMLETMCGIMAKPIPWAPGLLLRGDGYLTEFYRKED